MNCPSRLRNRLWDRFKDTRLSCRPSGKCLRALQEQSTSRWFLLQKHTEGHSARACEQNSNAQSSSKSATLGPLFGRTSLFKGNTRGQRRQGSSYAVSVKPTNNLVRGKRHLQCVRIMDTRLECTRMLILLVLDDFHFSC